MSRFFVPKENIKDDKILIIGEDVSHITKVLRLGIGDEITCCDGAGNDYVVSIEEADKKQVTCKVISKTKAETEPNISVTLIQGVPKASKMDYIIQKTTELGISKIYPCSLARCVSKVENDKKVDRWQKIAVEASKQSGRGVVPIVESPISLKDAIQVLKGADIAFVPYECQEESYLKPVLTAKADVKSVAFIIGPEGGFDKQEITQIEDAGIPVVTLGKRILRTETAGEAVLSMIMYEIGDING